MPSDFLELKEALTTDSFTASIVTALKENPSSCPCYSLVEQKFYFNGRLVIPCSSSPLLSSHLSKLLQQAHVTPFRGHGGFLKTVKHLPGMVYWPKLKYDVKALVQQCFTCQKNKYETQSLAGLLQPLSVPEQIWEDNSLDFIVGLPKSDGYDAILVVVHRLSKYCHFIPLSHPYAAKSVAACFCEEIVWLHGMPCFVLSN